MFPLRGEIWHRRSQLGFAGCHKGRRVHQGIDPPGLCISSRQAIFHVWRNVVKFVAIAVKELCLLSLTRCAISSFFSCTSHLRRQRYGSRPFWPTSIQKIQNAGGTRARAFFLVIRRQAETHDMGRKQMVRVWKGRYRHGQIRTWNSVNNTFFARSHFHHVQQILTQKSWSHGWKIQESFENSKSLTAAGTTMILYQRRLIYDGKSGSFNSDREFVRDSAKVRNTSSIP